MWFQPKTRPSWLARETLAALPAALGLRYADGRVARQNRTRCPEGIDPLGSRLPPGPHGHVPISRAPTYGGGTAQRSGGPAMAPAHRATGYREEHCSRYRGSTDSFPWQARDSHAHAPYI